MARDTQQLAYRAFTVIKRDGQDDFWQPIGAAFSHQDGKGFNIVLQANPLDGKIVLREPQDDQGDGRAITQDNRRDDNRRRSR